MWHHQLLPMFLRLSSGVAKKLCNDVLMNQMLHGPGMMSCKYHSSIRSLACLCHEHHWLCYISISRMFFVLHPSFIGKLPRSHWWSLFDCLVFWHVKKTSSKPKNDHLWAVQVQHVATQALFDCWQWRATRCHALLSRSRTEIRRSTPASAVLRHLRRRTAHA